jgi:predicted dehydrogenase
MTQKKNKRNTAIHMVKCAIVGLGRIGSLLEEDLLREKPCTHAGAIAENPECVLVGGCDKNKERRQRFSKCWNCRSVFGDIDCMLRETNPDILHIATPPESHLELVKKALSHNVKVVICEKPLTRSVRGATEIARIHRTGKMKILTNHERRYSEDYKQARRIIDEERYGQLLSVSSKLHVENETTLRNIMWHDGTHLVDAIHFLTSSCMRKSHVQGNLDKGGGSVFITGKAKDIPVVMEIGADRNHLVFEIDLGFTSGRLRIGNGLYEEFTSGASPYYENMNSLLMKNIEPAKGGRWPDGPTRYFSNMLIDAVQCVREGTREPVSSAIDGYNAVRFIGSL